MTTKKRRRLISDEPGRGRPFVLNNKVHKLESLSNYPAKLVLRAFSHNSLEQLTKEYPYIKILDMSSCSPIDAFSLQTISEKWIKRVSVLNLQYCDFITDNLLDILLGGTTAVLPHLRNINLSYTNITDLGVRLIVNKCPNLKIVNMNACRSITNLSVSMMAQHYSQISELKVEGCNNITDYGVQILAQQLKSNLRLLDLNDCSNITDQIFQYLCFYCPNLKYLYLRGTKITAETVLQFTTRFQLKSLNIQGIPISDAELFHIGYFQKQLEMLDISFCHSVTSTGLLGLLSGCTYLKVLYLFGTTSNIPESDFTALRTFSKTQLFY